MIFLSGYSDLLLLGLMTVPGYGSMTMGLF